MLAVKRALLVALLACGGLNAQSLFVQTAHGNCSGAASCTLSISPASGDTLLVQVQIGYWQTTAISSVKRSDGTACTEDAYLDQSSINAHMAWFRCVNVPSGITGVTATLTGTPSYGGAIFAEEVSGALLPSSPLDTASTSFTVTNFGSAWSAGPVTTTSSDIVFGMAAQNGYSSAMTGSPSWPAFLTNYTGGTSAILVYQQESSAGTYTPAGGTVSGGISAYAMAVAYKYNPPSYSVTPPSPASGYVLAASGAWTLTNATASALNVTISDTAAAHSTISGCSASGTLPQTATVPGSGNCTFTITPAALGTFQVSFHSAGNVDPTANNPTAYTSNACTLSMSDPGSFPFRSASGTITVSLTGCTFDGSHSVALSDGGNAGTITSGASAQNSLTVTPARGASSFTATYSAYLVGVKTLTASTAYADWAGAAPSVSHTVTRPDGCAFTAAADGNWRATGTWTAASCSHSYPDTGDSFTITGHHVTTPGGETDYAGTCPAVNTAYDAVLAPGGGASAVLEVQNGGKLWYCGNMQLNAPTSTNPASFAVVQLDTGAELDLDANQNASVAYRIVPGNANGYNLLKIGTSGDTCNFGTQTCPTAVKGVNLSGNPAGNPLLLDANSIADAMAYQIYGASVTDCGSASKGCITQLVNNSATSYANADLLDIEGSIFNRTGTVQPTFGAGVSGSTIWQPTLKNNRFLNDYAGVGQLTSHTGAAPSNCVISGNYFSGMVVYYSGNLAYWNCPWTGNAIMGDWGAYPYQLLPAGQPFSGNLIVRAVNVAIQSPAIKTQRNILVFPISAAATGSAHIFGPPYGTDGAILQDTVCFTADPSGHGEGHCFDGGSFNQNGYHGAAYGNLSLADAINGFTASQHNTFNNATSDPTTRTLEWIDHNGAIGPATYAWGATLLHGSATSPAITVLKSWRANLGWSPVTGTFNFGISYQGNASWPPLNVPNNNVNLSQVGWNAYYNPTNGATGSVFAGCTITASITSGSATATVSSSAPCVGPGANISGTGIPAGTTVSSCTQYGNQCSANTGNFTVPYTITLSANATATNSGATLTVTDPNCNPTTWDITGYHLCATSGAPQNDVILTGTPGSAGATTTLLDPTRNPFTWASRLHGQSIAYPVTSGNLAAAMTALGTALAQCQDLAWCIQEQWSWIRRGYQPMSLALKGKAPDGSIVGFSGSLGSGYTGTCGVSLTVNDTWLAPTYGNNLGHDFSASCTFVGGVPQIQITNPGANYLIAGSYTVAITGTCTGGCVAASLTPVISPHDIGPVQMRALPVAF